MAEIGGGMFNLADKKIAITGGSGFLGSYFVEELLGRGIGVRVLVRGEKSQKKLVNRISRYSPSLSLSLIEFVQTDLLDPVQMDSALEGVDVLIHAAAEVGFADSSDIISKNCAIAESVVDSLLRSNVQRTLHISSVAALGRYPDKDTVDEECYLDDLNNISNYSVSKFLSENQFWRAKELGKDVVIVNPSVILGVGDWKSGTSMLVPMCDRFMPFYTEGVTGYVGANDVARASLKLLECDEAVGERFIISAENISYRQLFTEISQALGRKKPFINLTKVTMSAFYSVLSFISKVTGKSVKMLSREIIRISQSKTYYDNSKVKQYIDFKFTPITEDIKIIVQAYKENK